MKKITRAQVSRTKVYGVTAWFSRKPAERAGSPIPSLLRARIWRTTPTIFSPIIMTTIIAANATNAVRSTAIIETGKCFDDGWSWAVANALDGLLRAKSPRVECRWRAMLEVSGESAKMSVLKFSRKRFPPTSNDDSCSFSRRTQLGGAPRGTNVILPAEVRPTVSSLVNRINAVGDSAMFVSCRRSMSLVTRSHLLDRVSASVAFISREALQMDEGL